MSLLLCSLLFSVRNKEWSQTRQTNLSANLGYRQAFAIDGCVAFPAEHRPQYHADPHRFSVASFFQIRIPDFAIRDSCKIVSLDNKIAVITFDRRHSHPYDVFISTFDVNTCSQSSWTTLFRVNELQSSFQPLCGFGSHLLFCVYVNENRRTTNETTKNSIFMYCPRTKTTRLITDVISDGLVWYQIAAPFFE